MGREVTEMQLGRLKTVDIRTVWKDEARDFTPWLLANSEYLSEALGLDLDLHAAEHSVGSYSLDLIGKVSESDDIVIVENQLETSDHRHLGQLLTYAGGTDARYVVWVSTGFREEHLSAIRWLNDGTTEAISFFAVEVSAVQIDDSSAAPQFTVVAQPNEWQKDTRSRTSATLVGERGQLQKKFWDLYLQRIRETHPDWTNAKHGMPQNWYALSSGVKNLYYVSAFTKDGKLASRIGMWSSDPELNKDRFASLESEKNVIEAAFGRALDWSGDGTTKHCNISSLKDGQFGDESAWEQQIAWLISQQEKFREIVTRNKRELKGEM
jgi:hypothetical protein